MSKNCANDNENENENGILHLSLSFESITRFLIVSKEYVGSDLPLPYTLQGIVIHMGTTESGHYYSYIKEDPYVSNRWYEFNDEYVTEISEKDIEKLCLGEGKVR